MAAAVAAAVTVTGDPRPAAEHLGGGAGGGAGGEEGGGSVGAAWLTGAGGWMTGPPQQAGPPALPLGSTHTAADPARQ